MRPRSQGSWNLRFYARFAASCMHALSVFSWVGGPSLPRRYGELCRCHTAFAAARDWMLPSLRPTPADQASASYNKHHSL